jgi:hypothetical protein
MAAALWAAALMAVGGCAGWRMAALRADGGWQRAEGRRRAGVAISEAANSAAAISEAANSAAANSAAAISEAANGAAADRHQRSVS